jgi:8-oxo-dGTP pyrophosphatase MutT (NUDIX family)
VGPDRGGLSRGSEGATEEDAGEFAVLAPIVEREGVESVLLTKRPDSLARYAGHVSLPGGARDPADRSLEETALRETFEEVGIPPDRIEIVRELDWEETALLHRVKPFLARVRAPYPLVPDAREVERILFLPVARITRDLFRVRGTWRDREGRERTTWTFDLEGFEVWGLTARILRAAFTE